MSGLNENRFRNKMISFRVSLEEYLHIQARIKISGMSKAEYIIKSLLNKEINISVGKYQSDRLSMELKKLREALECVAVCGDNTEIMKECKTVLTELQMITAKDNNVFEAK